MRLTRWEVAVLVLTAWLIVVDITVRIMTMYEARRARRWNEAQQARIRLRNLYRSGKM